MLRSAVILPRRVVRLISHAGWARYCPVCCKHARAFLDHGKPPRRGIKCPFCHALDRHRLDWLFFERRTDLFDGRPKRMLHVAPEKWLARRLRRIPALEYLSGDLDGSRAMEKMDITDIHYPDNHFSAIYCSHVLEHVPDDRKAMSELFRVLAPGGWAVLQVPILAAKTWEDPAITEPAERTRHFGQPGHVRACGPDYIDRMREAGFCGEAMRAKTLLSEDERERMAVAGNRLIFHCWKAAA